MFPAYHAESGLLTNDAIYFHNIAIELAGKIQESGWSNWKLWPALGCGLNVSMLSILYVFFGSDPSLAIPVNAILHASSGVLLYLIATNVCPGRVGHTAGIIASLFFITFPSSMNWYAQIHKDSYAITGLFLVLYSWVWWLSVDDSSKRTFYFFMGNIIGIFLLFSVRPYALDILFLVTMQFSLIAIGLCIYKRKIITKSVGAIVLVILIGLIVVEKDAFNTKDLYSQTEDAYSLKCEATKSWEWGSSSYVPKLIDNYAKASTRIRLRLICAGIDSNSIIDSHTVPENLQKMLIYVPRVLQVGLFAPFPNTWFSNFSITRIVGNVEILIWYLLVPGIILLVYQQKSPKIYLILIFSITYLTIYSYVTANLGTLHRVRYPFVMLLMLLGALGWCALLLKYFHLKILGRNLKFTYQNYDKFFGSSRVKLINSSIFVLVFTLLSFLMFFYRDVLIGQYYGVGEELDAFFLSMLLPMFFVNIVSIPLGSAVVPIFQDLLIKSSNAANTMLIHFLFFSLSILILISVVLIVFAGDIYQLVVSNQSTAIISRAVELLPYSVIILVLSSMIVLCNAMLNVRQLHSWPAIFQIIVPIFSIIALLVFANDSGIVIVIIGMIVGQILNLFFVIYLLARNGFAISLNISLRSQCNRYRETWKLYVALVFAALFVSAANVIDNFMASSLGVGNIGVYSLGSKVNIFISGLITIAVTSVLLPRFSALISRNAHDTCRQDLAFFIHLGTVVSLPIGLMLFGYCDDIVQAIFSGKMMTLDSAAIIGQVAIFGVIQLPFFVSNVLLVKFSNANKKGKLVAIAACIGLILNIVLNIILMRLIGVAGLALATTLSMLVTSLLLLIMFVRFGYLAVVDIILISLLWLLYLTAVMCIYFNSYAGVVISCGAMILLIWEAWFTHREMVVNT